MKRQIHVFLILFFLFISTYYINQASADECPVGLVDTEVGYCIDIGVRDTMEDWHSSNLHCRDAGDRLCSFSEMHYACTRAIVVFPFPSEWSDNFGFESGKAFLPCSDSESTLPTELIPFRCCRDMATLCGNGVIDDDEICDSNFQVCTTGDGYQGTEVCFAECDGFDACMSDDSCGDGDINGPELCDTDPIDCTIGDGYSGTRECQPDCLSAGPCTTDESCGDGILNGNEECDDGNTNPGDGCDQNCKDEPTNIMIWIEAENFTSIVSPMSVSGDGSASGGQFIQVPNGEGSSFTPGSVMTTYFVNLSQGGSFVLWGRSMAHNGLDDSFFVQIDNGQIHFWEVERDGDWFWDQINSRFGPDPVIFSLGPGGHIIKIIRRDDGTKLDKMLLTDDLSFMPTGFGM